MRMGHLAQLRLGQQPSLWAVAVCTCGLSFYFTLCFVRHLWPHESLLVVGAFGIAWELAKLHFGPRALAGLQHRGAHELAASLALMALTLVLMAGSIVASFGHLAQAHDHNLAVNRAEAAAHALRAAQASEAYRDARRAVNALDAEIDALGAAMAGDLAHHYRTRALTTARALAALRERRDIGVGQLARMQAIPDEAARAPDFFADLGAMLPGDAGVNAGRIKAWAHLLLAVMLELVGIAAWALIAGPQKPAPAQKTLGLTSGGELAGKGPEPCARDAATGWPRPPEAPDGRPVHDLVPRRTLRGTWRGTIGGRGARHCAKQVSGGAPCGKCCVCAQRKYEDAKRLVLAQLLVPQHRSLRLRLQIGQRTAQAFLRELCREGYIERAGRGYKIACMAGPAAA